MIRGKSVDERHIDLNLEGTLLSVECMRARGQPLRGQGTAHLLALQSIGPATYLSLLTIPRKDNRAPILTAQNREISNQVK